MWIVMWEGSRQRGRAFQSQEWHEHIAHFGEQGVLHRTRDGVGKLESLEHRAKGVGLYPRGVMDGP